MRVHPARQNLDLIAQRGQGRAVMPLRAVALSLSSTMMQAGMPLP